MINVIVIVLFVFIAFVFLKKNQNQKLNWSMFYSTLYVVVALPIVNYICTYLGFWKYIGTDNFLRIPFNLYFIWVISWAIIPVYFCKGKYISILSLVIIWIDFLIMPLLKGEFKLGNNWLWGEIVLIGTVFVPSYYWAFCSYTKRYIAYRAILQVLVMGIIFTIGLPLILINYGFIKNFTFQYSPFLSQLFIIIIFPSLVAVNDLVKKGKGTPFPYDKTEYLVQTGVYAYCKNPIQWSFTFMFIPLAIYYETYILLLGAVFSIAYSFGISDYQEYEDMESRYGKRWSSYKNNIPKWRFLWKPKYIPKGDVYFDSNCKQCNGVKQWFINVDSINLNVKIASEFKKKSLIQATYIDHNGNEYKSINAIAHCLEHVNLAYATLGWFIRFPLINYILQSIIDSMSFDNDNCSV